MRDREAVLRDLRSLIVRFDVSEEELLSLAVHTLEDRDAREGDVSTSGEGSTGTPPRTQSKKRIDLACKGWNAERDFESWRKLFVLEMEKRLVRAHKDYNVNFQAGMNAAVQVLSGVVAILGTISLILFTQTSDDAEAEFVVAANTTVEERIQADLEANGIFSARWYFNIAITLASLLATGLSNRASRRATRTADIVKACDAFFNTRNNTIQKYRKVLKVSVDERPPYAKFREDVRDLETREEGFVDLMTNTEKFWALLSVALWDKPAYHRYFRFCVVYTDRKVCGLTFCFLLNFMFGPVIQQFHFVNERQTAAMVLYYFSREQLCAHLNKDQLKEDGSGHALAVLSLHTRFPDEDGIHMGNLEKALDEFVKDLKKQRGVIDAMGDTLGIEKKEKPQSTPTAPQSPAAARNSADLEA